MVKITQIMGGLLAAAGTALWVMPIAWREHGPHAYGGEWLLLGAAFAVGCYFAPALLDWCERTMADEWMGREYPPSYTGLVPAEEAADEKA